MSDNDRHLPAPDEILRASQHTYLHGVAATHERPLLDGLPDSERLDLKRLPIATVPERSNTRRKEPSSGATSVYAHSHEKV